MKPGRDADVDPDLVSALAERRPTGNAQLRIAHGAW